MMAMKHGLFLLLLLVSAVCGQLETLTRACAECAVGCGDSPGDCRVGKCLVDSTKWCSCCPNLGKPCVATWNECAGVEFNDERQTLEPGDRMVGGNGHVVKSFPSGLTMTAQDTTVLQPDAPKAAPSPSKTDDEAARKDRDVGLKPMLEMAPMMNVGGDAEEEIQGTWQEPMIGPPKPVKPQTSGAGL